LPPSFFASSSKTFCFSVWKACEAEHTEPYWAYSCKAFQAFQTEKQKVFEEDAKKDGGKGLVKTWMLAGVDRLADENRLVRAIGAQVIGNVLYAYYHASVKDVDAYRMALVESYRASKDLSEKEHVISLLSTDGGTGQFQGGEEISKWLQEVASKDSDPKARKAAIQVISYCVEERCKVPADQVKAWFAAEQDADAKDALVRVAAKVKLAAEVDAYCKPGFEAGKPTYGCADSLRLLLDESRFEATLALVTALTQNEATKQKGEDFIASAMSILTSKGREKWAQDKTRKLLEAVMASKDTVEKRSPYLIANLSTQVQGMASLEKPDLQWAVKVLAREEARYSRAWKKDLDKDTAKAGALKTLKTSLDLMKKRLAEAK
jgi:hypothetical protein